MSRRARPLLSRRWRWYRRLWLRVVFPGADLNKREHRVAAEHAFADVWFSAWYPYYLGLVIAAAYGGLTVGLMYLQRVQGMKGLTVSGVVFHVATSLILMIALPAVGAITVDAILLFCVRALLGRNVRRSIRRSGVDLCVSCGYLLKGVPADSTCPECGAMREQMSPLGPS